MDQKGIRPGVWIAVLGGLGALILVLTLFGGSPEPASKQQESAAAPEEKPLDLASKPPSASDRRNANRTPVSAPDEPVPYIEGLVWGDIDLREAKALMPDNLYWKWAAPTKDEKVLAEREAERKRRNEEYGRVVAGDASEEEVRAYYDYKRQISSDYLEFAEFMSRRFRNTGPESFQGMLDLAVKMHTDRLALLDGEMEDALNRARERAKIREDWARQKAEFGDAPVGDEEEPRLDDIDH